MKINILEYGSGLGEPNVPKTYDADLIFNSEYISVYEYINSCGNKMRYCFNKKRKSVLGAITEILPENSTDYFTKDYQKNAIYK